MLKWRVMPQRVNSDRQTDSNMFLLPRAPNPPVYEIISELPVYTYAKTNHALRSPVICVCFCFRRQSEAQRTAKNVLRSGEPSYIACVYSSGRVVGEVGGRFRWRWRRHQLDLAFYLYSIGLFYVCVCLTWGIIICVLCSFISLLAVFRWPYGMWHPSTPIHPPPSSISIQRWFI